MAFVTYDARFWAPKLYALEALKVGIGLPFAKPRAALGAAHAAPNAVLHDKIVNSDTCSAELGQPWANIYTAYARMVLQSLSQIRL
jgi:hypothetical protein